MNPMFISWMLQSLAGLTSGFSIGRRSQRRREEPAFTSSKFLFEAGHDEDDGEKALALRRKRGAGWGKGDCFCWHLATGVKQHLFVSKTYILAAQSFPFKVRTVWDACTRPRIPQAGHGAGRGHQCLPREGTWKEKPAFWCTGVSLRVVSLLAEEAQITTWVLFLFFI